MPEALLEHRAVDLDGVRGDVGPRLLVAERGLDDPAEELVGVGVEAADDPPVDDADAAVGQQQQVARRARRRGRSPTGSWSAGTP